MFRRFPADFRYVLGLQESVVVAMADGFAQARGDAALVNLHSAIGVGHALGSIFTAYRNQTPLLITAGQQARAILPFEPFLYSEQADPAPQAVRQMELRAGACRRCSRGDRARLLHRHAAAARPDIRLGAGGRLGSWVPRDRAAAGQPTNRGRSGAAGDAAAGAQRRPPPGDHGRRLGGPRRCLG